MQSIAYQYEQQIHLMEQQRQRNAARAEQLRLARAASAPRVGRLRAALGDALIALGERLSRDLAPANEEVTPVAGAQRA